MKHCTFNPLFAANFVSSFINKWVAHGLLWGFLLLHIGCQPSPESRLQHLQGMTMGTEYHVKMVDVPSRVDVQVLHQQIEQRLQHINALMSTYQKDSALSRFNQSTSTEWQTVPAELLYVIEAGLQFSHLSEGAFDITVGPLVNLWGFGPAIKAGEIPQQADISAAQARVGFQHLQTRSTPPAVKKTRPDVYVDLSAIAKGYAVDQLADHLDSLGIQHYLVDIGGELRTAGMNAEGQRWRIAIEKPVPAQRAVQRMVDISDIGVATSGSYRNFFQLQGQQFSHTIDPQTGWPVKHRLVSVTVLHARAMEADAWATTLMVLGVEKALKLAEQEDLAVFLLEDSDTGVVEHASSAFLSWQTD